MSLHINITTPILVAVFLVGFAFLVFFLLRRQHNKKYAPKDIVVPQFEPPQGLHPIMMGMLQDVMMDPSDLLGGIVRLAEEGIIELRNLPEERNDYAATLKKTIEEIQDPIDRLLVPVIFGEEVHVGQVAKLSTLWEIGLVGKQAHSFSMNVVFLEFIASLKYQKRKVSELYQYVISKMVEMGLLEYYGWTKKKRALVSLAISLISGAASLALLFTIELIIVAGPLGMISFFSMSFFFITLIFSSSKWRAIRRTAEGDTLRDEVLGFHHYLEVTGKDRYAKYPIPSEEGKYIVEYLPYAVALGVTTDFVNDVLLRDSEYDPSGKLVVNGAIVDVVKMFSKGYKK